MIRQYKTYQHYKGGIYLVLGESLHTETNETLIVYVCAVSGLMFSRPKEMFFEHVNIKDYTGPRFIENTDNVTKEGCKLFSLLKEN